jgi:hypothetical protein
MFSHAIVVRVTFDTNWGIRPEDTNWGLSPEDTNWGLSPKDTPGVF